MPVSYVSVCVCVYVCAPCWLLKLARVAVSGLARLVAGALLWVVSLFLRMSSSHKPRLFLFFHVLLLYNFFELFLWVY